MTALSDRPIRSLVWSTNLEVLERGRVVLRRDGYWVARSPANPDFWWGNLVLFDEPPGPGDGERWEAVFDDELPDVRHRLFGWDRTDGATGTAETEFAARGYELGRTAGLRAGRGGLRHHPRANREVTVRRLDPDGDAERWSDVVEVWVAGRPDGVSADAHAAFAQRRIDGLRTLLRAGRGGWYAALDGERLVACCGVVTCGARARYQAVDTVESHRRRGICSRLLVDAAADIEASHPEVHEFVIAADPDYHAIGIYESIGFERRELVCGALRVPAEDRA